MPLFSPLLRRFEAPIWHARRTRLSQRLAHVIAQDRVDRLAATTATPRQDATPRGRRWGTTGAML